jgi:mannosyltransferase OCH1-like enzyme
MYKFLLIIVMCLFIILLYFDKKIPENFKNNSAQIITKSYLSNDKVPKIIWTYWDTDEVPEIVKLSMKSWRKTSPNYFINLMNQKMLKNMYHYRKIGKDYRPIVSLI